MGLQWCRICSLRWGRNPHDQPCKVTKQSWSFSSFPYQTKDGEKSLKLRSLCQEEQSGMTEPPSTAGLSRDFTLSDSDFYTKWIRYNVSLFQKQGPLSIHLLRSGQGQGARPASGPGGHQHLRGHAGEAGQPGLRGLGLGPEGQETGQPQPRPGSEVSIRQEGRGHQHQQAAHPAHPQVTRRLHIQSWTLNQVIQSSDFLEETMIHLTPRFSSHRPVRSLAQCRRASIISGAWRGGDPGSDMWVLWESAVIITMTNSHYSDAQQHQIVEIRQ